MKGTKDFYNKTAENWLNNRKDDHSLIPMFEKLFNYLPMHPRILDLCCGVGYESQRLANLGGDVVGVDFSDVSIEMARENYPEVTFTLGNMLEDYSHLGEFDGATIIAGFVHLSNEQLPIAFHHLSNALKENAYVFIVVKDGLGKSIRMSHKRIDGEDYDREFYDHTLDELIEASKDVFQYVDNYVSDESSMWKNYYFRKR